MSLQIMLAFGLPALLHLGPHFSTSLVMSFAVGPPELEPTHCWGMSWSLHLESRAVAVGFPELN
jgi:hypothetical protein